MAYADLDTAFKAIIGYEGKYTNDPADPGGPTKFGVTLKTLEGWRRQTLTADDVKALGIDEAKQIFAAQYWDKVDGSNLPAGVDFAVVDMAYNAGAGQAVKILQRCLGVRVDGVAGAITTKAANDADHRLLVINFCEARLKFLKGLSGWPRYGKGWTNRVKDVERKSLALVNRTPASVAVGTVPMDAMDGHAGDRQTKVLGTTSGQTKLVGAVGLVGSQASSAAESLTPYTDTFAILKYVFIALMVLGIVAGFYVTIERLKSEDPQA
jgi:lysozyme family protein